MTPALWKRIDALFALALARRGADRTSFLDDSCAGDPELRDELDSLLACADDDGRELRAAIEREADTLGAQTTESAIGRRVGAYRLRELVGEGGMGVVYRAARDDDTYKSDVAIKILRVGLGSPTAIARFRDERQILARLDHPGIVRLLDGGRTDDDLPYLVMEHLVGVSITQFARDRALTVRSRVRLVVPICDAVSYAHRRLVVHRDLKPSNILVGGDGTPKLLDFGIAKLLADDAEREARTQTGGSPLTMAYASPEQLRGEPTSTATDVYSLGAVLYELLVDAPPHDAGPATAIAICELDAPLASLTAPPARRRELAGDLDNILRKALRRDPAERYRSVEELGDDLGRYLAGHPVTARAPTLGYRAGKWLRRNRVVVSVATAVVAVVAALGLASILRIQRARADLDDTVNQLYVEHGRELLLKDDPDRALAYLAAALEAGMDTPALRYLVATANRQRDQERLVLHHRGGVLAIAWRPDGAVVATGAMDGEAYLWDARTGAELTTLAGHEVAVTSATFSPDGAALVTADNDGVVIVRDGATGIARGAALAGVSGEAPAFLGPDRLVMMGAGGQLEIRDVATLAVVDRVELAGGAWAVGAGRLAVANVHGVQVVGTGCQLSTIDSFDGVATGVALDPSGQFVAVWTSVSVAIIDLATCKETSAFTETASVGQIVFGPEDGELAVLGADGGLQLREVTTDRPLGNLVAHAGLITTLTASPRADRLMSAGVDGTVALWLPSGGLEQRLHVHVGAILCGAMSPDGTAIATGSMDRTARITSTAKAGVTATVKALQLAPASVALYWSTMAGIDPGVDASAERAEATRFAGKEDLLILNRDGTVLRRHGELRLPLGIQCPKEGARCAPSGDGGRLAIVAGNRAWTVDLDGRRGPTVEHAAPIHVLDVIPNSPWITTASADGEVRLWDGATGQLRHQLLVTDDVTAVAWTPDGTRVATRGPDNVTVWDASGGVLRRFPTRARGVQVVALDASGVRVIGPNDDGQLAIWDVASGDLLALIEPHQREVSGVAFSPDGAFVASASEESARLDDARTGEILGYFDRTLRYGPASTVAFDPTGSRLVVSGVDTLVRVWDVSVDTRPARAILDDLACRGGFALDGSVARPVATRSDCGNPGAPAHSWGKEISP